jgi:hypothetical protein
MTLDVVCKVEYIFFFGLRVWLFWQAGRRVEYDRLV